MGFRSAEPEVPRAESTSIHCTASICRAAMDVLPGEEALHERLQRELIDSLLRLHQESGLVVQIEARLSCSGSTADLHGMIRTIQAAPGRYSCEFVELSPHDGSSVENRFFTLVPPEEERSRASVLILAKAAALIGSPDVQPLPEGEFDAIIGRASSIASLGHPKKVLHRP